MITRNAKGSNQEKGKDLENRLILYLSRNLGYWAHFMHPAPDGSQPFDIIAARGLMDGDLQVCAFDCKTLEGDRFPFSRAEYNQISSFRVLNIRGILDTYFAVEVEKNRVFFIPSQHIETLMELGKKSMNMKEWAQNHADTNIEQITYP